ncbi:hypothetical protein FO488_15605 [Geobacter sp. FeAm09]|nr:hypothetical protein FO488_15605 [Geobacter sp. FeAm09]
MFLPGDARHLDVRGSGNEGCGGGPGRLRGGGDGCALLGGRGGRLCRLGNRGTPGRLRWFGRRRGRHDLPGSGRRRRPGRRNGRRRLGGERLRHRRLRWHRGRRRDLGQGRGNGMPLRPPLAVVQEQEGGPEGDERRQQHQPQDEGPVAALLVGGRAGFEQFPGNIDHAGTAGLPLLLALQLFQGI